MALQSLTLLQYQEAPFEREDSLIRAPFINGGHPSAIRPLVNLYNRYYIVQQAKPIARTNPPAKAIAAPTALAFSGFGSTYRFSDESLRQYTLGAQLENRRRTYYQTAP